VTYAETTVIHLLSAGVTSEGVRAGVVVTAYVLGFRHGIDWDHIAAITDITSSQEEPRTSMWFATLYALGHALVVFVLGVVAVFGGELLPKGIDAGMERVVGGTLILLGVYVFYSLVRHGRNFRMRSRWMLIFAAVRRVVGWFRYRSAPVEEVTIEHEHAHAVNTHHEHHHPAALAAVSGGSPVLVETRTHRHRHAHRAPMPDDPFMNYGRLTSFVVGTIHGVGAETPTQVLLFLAAVGAGGRGAGILLLGVFLIGLLSSNTVVAVASTFGFLRAGRSFRVYAAVAVLTGTFSIVVGSIFLFGRASFLSSIFSG
jgi:high-affinity nickel-transport protein